MKTTIEKIFDLYAGGDVQKKSFSKYKFQNFSYPVYSNSLSNSGLYGYTNNPRYKANSITITGRGKIGVAMYRQTDFDAIVRLLVLTPKNADTVNPKFMTEFINKYIEFSIESTGVPQLTVPQVAKIELDLPSKLEQDKIAISLSDIDQIITSLSGLIKKKQQIRIAALEDLITGKRKLEGMKSKWECINLGENSLLKARIGWQGLTTSEYLESGFAYLVTGTDFKKGTINWKNIHFVEKYRYDQDRNIQLRNDDLLLTKDGTIGKVALVKNLNKPATLNSGVFVIRPKNNGFLTEYVYYILTSSIFKKFLNKLAAGSTISHLYQKDLTNFEFFLPSSLKEQKAIATILSDMDEEILKLEEKLEKYKKIKQGMMEQLLTGKIRLI
ncbi:restriction endonuclease subunit S [Lactococcus formosensis]|uniref:restriction endonuclease subunit S n=1 Tax=Lactococcus formosensis TaxID=1281486 RepID=UPI0032456CA6